MRSGFITSMLGVLMGTGLSLAQVTELPRPTPPSGPAPATPNRPWEALARGDYATGLQEPPATPPVKVTPSGEVANGDYAVPPAPPAGATGANGEGQEPWWIDPRFHYSRGPWSPDSRFFLYGEYLLMWLKDGSVPELIGTIPSTLAGSAGNLPSNAINSLYPRPGTTLDYRANSGFRVTAGYWLDDAQRVGVDASYFRLERGTIPFAGSSQGNPVFGPLWFDPVENRQVILLAADPGPGARAAEITAGATESFWGLETNVRVDTTLFSDRTDMLLGFRYLSFSEGINIQTISDGIFGDPQTELTRGITQDRFGTLNQFYGPQIGLSADRRYGNWFLDIGCKLSLGVMHQVAKISGTTQFSGFSPQFDGIFPRGILAEPTNIGEHTRERFVAVPELTITVGRQVTSRLRAFCGYNLIYVSSVLRPGDLIEGVDSRQVMASARFDPSTATPQPGFFFSGTDFWAQGFTFGLEFRY